ncbi:hypothetical protein G8759_04575 [Spirosoma aureum]|uniref:SGNH/GDSL hydrolase family protein n=1 Tax=Spirosoma aureum TaxID=2692134 RepID=A0A6G9AHL2_9BACT|nr:hypothetical protein [Spirosoma aureum]QIP11957.1 hypothetical protein G8759_04575 [Spirosoma aureum]
MNTQLKFYRFFYWAITLLLLGSIPVLCAQLMREKPPGAPPEVASIYSILYIIIGFSVISVVSYVLLYGKSWAKGSILSLLSFVLSWFILEGICAVVLHWKDGTPLISPQRTVLQRDPIATRRTNFSLIRYDSLGMSRPSPGQYETIYSIKENRLIHGKPTALEKNRSVAYHIDSLSRRITPFDKGQSVGKYALFLGCSFTYGESVSDTSTIPYFFGRQTGYHPYNYGVSGHSPAHMLALLQTINIRKEVAEKNGVAFYTYIEDHLARVAPSTRWAYNSDGYLPHVNADKLTVDGSYAQKHPVRLKLIQWMYKSNVARLFKLNFPGKYSTEQYRRFVNIVRKSKELYNEQFGNDNFYVVIFPMYPMDTELRQLFNQARIKLIDYSNLLTWKTAYDGMHPDGEAYRRVAQKLADDFDSKLEQPITLR